jgi:hypothetical protein
MGFSFRFSSFPFGYELLLGEQMNINLIAIEDEIIYGLLDHHHM